VAAGRAPPGSVLPSVRALAAELGVATGTVAAAYRLLAGRGIVEGHRRAGTRVRRPVDVRRRGTAVPLGLRDLATGNPDPALLPDLAQALTKATATNGDGRGPCGLSAEPAGPPAKVVQPTSLPVTPPASPSVNAPTSSTGGRLYGGAAVLPALESWARRSFEADGIILEGLTVASGALDAVQRALEVHLRPGARVAVEDPGYAGLLDLLGVLGLVAEPVRVDADGMVATALGTALARGAQAVVLTPRAQNPTGAALTPARARALQDVCRRAPDVLVVEDDHAGPVSGAPAVTVVGGSSGRGRRVVVVRSFSKSLGPDLRLAMVAADLHTAAAIEARQSVGAGWVSHLLQGTALALVSDPRVAAGLVRTGEMYSERREALLARLADLGTTATGRSGLNVWVPVADEDRVVAGMAARGWAVAAGSRYRVASPPAVRVTTATLGADVAPSVAADLVASLALTGHNRAG